MTGNDVFSMSVDMAEPNSLVIDGNAYNTNFISASSSDLNVLNNRDQIMCGFPGPSVLEGDSNNSQAFIHATNSGRISNSCTLENVQPERDSFGDFLYGIPFPINNAPAQGRYMEGMPLSAESLSTLLAARWNPQENLEKFAASSSLAYSLPRDANSIPNSDTLNSSSQITMRYVHDGVSAGTGAKWELNDFFVHPDPAVKALGRAGLQPFESMVNFDPNGWVTSQNTSLSSDGPSGSSRLSNELSLSLATSNPSAACRPSLQDQCSEICCSSSQYERCLGSEQTSCSRNLSLNFHSSKPVQLPQLFSRSRYVRAMQEILAEVAFYSLGNLDLMYPATGTDDQGNVSFSSCCTAGEGYSLPDSDDFPDADQRATLQIDPSNQSWEVERKKKRLLTLLQLVDDQYNQCLDEIHTVISAFHAVTELNPHIHTRFALHTVSFLYRNLRERISNHILAMGVHFSKGVVSKENSFETSFIQRQWALQQLKRKDNQLWRPQRGLPERSVSVLRAWMFQNFPPPVSQRCREALACSKKWFNKEPGLKLVYKCPSTTLEANDRRNVCRDE